IEGEPARGQAILLLAADGAEVARAEKSGDVAVPVRVEIHAKAREAELPGQRPRADAALAQVEHRGVVADRPGLPVDDLVHLDRAREGAAQMKEPDLKVEVLSEPERTVATKPDGLVSIVVQLGQDPRHDILRLPMWVPCAPPGPSLQPGEVEGLRLPRRPGSGGGGRRRGLRRQGEKGSGFEQ